MHSVQHEIVMKINKYVVNILSLEKNILGWKVLFSEIINIPSIINSLFGSQLRYFPQESQA